MVAGGEHLSVMMNNGGGTFAAEVDYGPVVTHSIEIADVDADGDPDLVYANLLGPMSVLPNNGDGTFDLASEGLYDAGISLNAIALGDLDGDGDLDAAAANWFSGDETGTNFATLLENDGTGVFSQVTTIGADDRCRYVGSGRLRR